jgi:DNA processing protein
VRNRLIAALAAACVVVAAAPRSGSLVTARLALDLGREVLAVPGRVTDELALGTNALVADGARPALDPRDVLEAIASPRRAMPAARAGPAPRRERSRGLERRGASALARGARGAGRRRGAGASRRRRRRARARRADRARALRVPAAWRRRALRAVRHRACNGAG